MESVIHQGTNPVHDLTQLLILLRREINHPLLGFLFRLTLLGSLNPALNDLNLVADVGESSVSLLQQLSLLVGVDVQSGLDRTAAAFDAGHSCVRSGRQGSLGFFDIIGQLLTELLSPSVAASFFLGDRRQIDRLITALEFLRGGRFGGGASAAGASGAAGAASPAGASST